MLEAGARVPPSVAARRIRVSVDPVRALARAMGERVVQVPTEAWLPVRNGPSVSTGGDSYIDQATGDVYLVRGMRTDRRFHEIMHAICDPPELRCVMAEHLMLLQVERAYARYCLPPKQYREVLAFQAITHIEWGDDCGYFDEIDYEARAWWTEGYRVAQRIGLLDARRRPTLRPANWGAFPKVELRKLMDAWRNDYG
jgi:hypothetical protein